MALAVQVAAVLAQIAPEAVTAGGNSQDRNYQTSNRGSGSQANHFGNPGSLSSGGGCTGGGRAERGHGRN
ncbi:hypothetical protein AAHR75_003643 [Yersinia enterocolitica]|uniref:hypothetical protein n=1 Tax=Yersinia enterocolitica TaxID=630 RepID=UPI003145B8E0